MCLREHALLYCKVMITKSVKSHLTRKETRSLQRAVTKHAEFGRQRLAMKFRYLMATKMKYSLVLSITKEIQLLQAPRTTLAAFGKIKQL